MLCRCFPSGFAVAKSPSVFPVFGLSRRFGLALVALTSACSGGGDVPSKPVANAFGGCLRLSALGGPAAWQNPADEASATCKVTPDQQVCVSGVTIIAIDRYDETGKGARGNYYVQDTEGEADYSGMTIYNPSFSPPDLRLAEGDVADVIGTRTEFLGPSSNKFGGCKTLPEISGTMSFRFDGGPPIAPKVISALELTTYEAALKHLGKLVKIENVAIASDGEGSGGRYSATIDVGSNLPSDEAPPQVSNELFDLEHYGADNGGGGGGGGGSNGSGGLKGGTTFTSITGVVTYFYGFKIAPRSAADLEP